MDQVFLDLLLLYCIHCKRVVFLGADTTMFCDGFVNIPIVRLYRSFDSLVHARGKCQQQFLIPFQLNSSYIIYHCESMVLITCLTRDS